MNKGKKFKLTFDEPWREAPVVFIVNEFDGMRDIYEPLAKKGTLGVGLKIVSEDGDIIKEYEK